MDIAAINYRVDKALRDNRRAENIIIGMTIGIFLLGLAVVIVGYWAVNPYISGGAILLEGLIYWPIKEILKLRRDNLVLQTVPTIVTAIPPDRAADEIVKALEFLRR
jgi:hypothetical protein